MVKKPWGRWTLIGEKKHVIQIPIEKINRNPFQTRRENDDGQIDELAASIEQYGVIQPIIIRPQGEEYQIVVGERRFRACHKLGYAKVPAIVQEMDDERAAAVSLIENLQRRDLNCFEEASALNILSNVFGLGREEAAVKVGKSPAAMAEKIELLKIPEALRSLITSNSVSEDHARALLPTGSSELQTIVLQQIIDRDLTVKETEDLVQRIMMRGMEKVEKNKGSSNSIAMVIKDARIFLNTIKEIVKRAEQNGVDIVMKENEDDKKYEVIISIAKREDKTRYMVQGEA